MYIAVDECFVKGDSDQPDSLFMCVVIEAYIWRKDDIARSEFTIAECEYHDIISGMIDDHIGIDSCEGYWTHALKSLGRKLKEHGYCEKFCNGEDDRGAVLFVDANLMTRSELLRIVDNARAVVRSRNEGDTHE